MAGRRALLAALPVLLAAPAVRAQGEVTAQDLLGRQVRLPRPPRRVVLAHGRQLNLLGLLHPDPVSLLTGWAEDMPAAQPGEMPPWRRRFPAIDAVPLLPRRLEEGPALERLLVLSPDLVLLPRPGTGASAGMAKVLSVLEGAGIPAAVVDIAADPLRDTLPSIGLLGALLGREAQAAALSEFYAARRDRVAALVASVPDRPRVLLHNHAGGREGCCMTIARGSFAEMIAFAGGRNMAAEILPGALGEMSLEYVLTRPPEVYLATGGVYNERGGVALGSGVDPATARRSLARVLARPGLSGLEAVRQGRAHGIWHGFNETPLHVLALEMLARWLHPSAAAGLAPEQGLEECNRRFAAVPLEGSFWCSL
jgi:iron complex transport system substrate-binding protein